MFYETQAMSLRLWRHYLKEGEMEQGEGSLGKVLQIILRLLL